MSKLSLQWPVDQDGYDIEAPSPRTTKAAKNDMGDPGPSIVRKGGTLVFRDPLKIDGLYRQLADTPPTPQGARDFVSHFGFLTATRSASESVEFICNEIRGVKSLLKLKRSRNWDALHLWIINNPKIGLARPELQAGDPPALFFRPATLRDAVILQFLDDLTPGTNLRRCKSPGCKNWFRFGPGTSHRSTGHYCSPKCRDAHKYLLRKEAQS